MKIRKLFTFSVVMLVLSFLSFNVLAADKDNDTSVSAQNKNAEIHLSLASAVFSGVNEGKPALDLIQSSPQKDSQNTALSASSGKDSGYTMVIRYILAPDYAIAAQPYRMMLDYGESYHVVSPTITGYTPDQAVVSGTVSGSALPADHMMVVDVHYQPKTDIPYVIKNYFQDLSGNYVLDDSLTETHLGATAATVTLYAKAYTGFTATKPKKEIQIAADGSTVVEFYYERDYCWVNYVSSDGSFIKSVYDTVGSAIDIPSDPTRTGYGFAGWSDTPPTTMPAENTTITADWTALDTTYTVIYWNENADPNADGSYGYSYYDQATLTAKSGSTPVITGAVFNDNGDTALPSQTYFTYDHYDEGVTIAGDGSTYVNVYYSRNSYTLTFNLNDVGAAYTGTLTMGENTYTTATGQYSFTAKYESNIRTLWPTATQVTGTNGYTFGGWLGVGGATTYISLRLTLTSDLIDTSGTREFNARWSNASLKYELHYMLETPDGSGTEYDGRYYVQSSELSQLAYAASASWAAKTISGFTSVAILQDDELNDDDDYDVMLYYSRNTYNLKFINTGVSDTSHDQSLPFDADISGLDWAPAHPAYLPQYYTFDGWYTTSSCLQEQKYVWNGAIMPSHALTLYAHWAPPTLTVNFDAGGGSPVPDQTIIYGEELKNPGETLRDGYALVGWYQAGDIRFPFSEPVTEDMSLTAKWKVLQNIAYTVKYQDVEGNDVADALTVPLNSVGDTVTAKAVVVEGLAPNLTSHSMVIGGNAADNVITFTYQPYDYLSYTVRYLDADTNQAIKDDLVVDQTEYNRVTVKAADISGYMPLAYQKSAVLAIDPALNVITFYYKAYTPVPLALNGTDHYAYIVGYPDHTVRPEANLTRAEAATIFFRLLNDEVRTKYSTKVNSFSDVKANAWYCRAVSTLAAMGILKGYENGTFQPNGKITRAELAAMASRFDENNTVSQRGFSDIAGHWGEAEIKKAAQNGWVQGYPDGSFKPNLFINRAETITLINHILHRLPETEEDLLTDMVQWPDNADPGKWYYTAIQEAANSHAYTVKAGAIYEKWLSLQANRDWTSLEN